MQPATSFGNLYWRREDTWKTDPDNINVFVEFSVAQAYYIRIAKTCQPHATTTQNPKAAVDLLHQEFYYPFDLS